MSDPDGIYDHDDAVSERRCPDCGTRWWPQDGERCPTCSVFPPIRQLLARRALRGARAVAHDEEKALRERTEV